MYKCAKSLPDLSSSLFWPPKAITVRMAPRASSATAPAFAYAASSLSLNAESIWTGEKHSWLLYWREIKKLILKVTLSPQPYPLLNTEVVKQTALRVPAGASSTLHRPLRSTLVTCAPRAVRKRKSTCYSLESVFGNSSSSTSISVFFCVDYKINENKTLLLWKDCPPFP